MRTLLMAVLISILAFGVGLLVEIVQTEWIDGLLILAVLGITLLLLAVRIRLLPSGRRLIPAMLIGSLGEVAAGIGLVVGLYALFALSIGDREAGEWPPGEAPVPALLIWAASAGGVLGVLGGVMGLLMNRVVPMQRSDAGGSVTVSVE